MSGRSRREFLRRTGGALGGSALLLPPFTWGQEATRPGAVPAALEPNPLAEVIEQFRRDQMRRSSDGRASGPSILASSARGRGSADATGSTREAYLDMAGGIVRAFLPRLDARAAVIDPYEGVERPYATAALALAAGVLATRRAATSLLDPAQRALDAASAALAAGPAPDGGTGHSALLLMLAERVLSSSVAPDRRATWRRNLAAVHLAPVSQAPPSHLDLVAACGGWLRYRAGLSLDVSWVEASVARQMGAFVPAGLYREPGDSLAYDQLARLHAGILLDEGYDRAGAAVLGELLERGAWASLFLQSPHGEVATGGAGALHQWNEAALILTCEAAARRFVRRGEHAGAGALRRGAHLALQSLRRWVRPTGDLWIVKNRFDPAERHGYDPRSSHSGDNLLVAAYLALGYLAAEDRIPERPCPAEIGGFALALQPAFHKLVLNAGGYYAEIETDGQPCDSPTGIVRLHHPDVEPGLLTDGVPPSCVSPSTALPTVGLALGPAWRDAGGRWSSLADHGGRGGAATLTIAAQSPARLECEVTLRDGLRGGATAVRASFFVTPTTFSITVTVEGDVMGTRLMLPVLVGDGDRSWSIEVAERRAVVRPPRGGGFSFEIGGSGAAVSRLGRVEGTRAGLVDAAVAETDGRTIRCVIRPLVPGAS